MARSVMRAGVEGLTPQRGENSHGPLPDTPVESKHPHGPRQRPAAPPAEHRVALRRDDIQDVQSRFDRRLPGSCWCGFASWEETFQRRRPRPQDCRNGAVNDAGTARLVLFTDTDGRRYLTLSRFDDGHLELTNEVGRVIASADRVGALIDIIERPGRR